MTPLRRLLVAAGLIAPACAPTPTGHKARVPETAVSEPPLEAAGDAVELDQDQSPPTLVEPAAPTTTVTVRKMPPTTTGRTTTTFVLPEDVGSEQTDEEYWASQPGYSGAWPALAQCESGNANVDTGNGYSGFFQFSDATWRSMKTGYPRAVDAPFAVQLDAAMRLQARSGWKPWPACSRKLGLR